MMGRNFLGGGRGRERGGRGGREVGPAVRAALVRSLCNFSSAGSVEFSPTSNRTSQCEQCFLATNYSQVSSKPGQT